MAKIIDVFKSNDGPVRQSNYVFEITNLIRMARNIYFVRFTRYIYCSKNDEVRFPKGETNDIYNQNDNPLEGMS